MTMIVLVRHAATEWSGLRYSGRGDPPLSPVGLREAEALAERLERELTPGIRIVTSPSRRAHDTAAILGTRLAPAVIEVDERWMETDVGEAEGLTFDEVAARYPDVAVRLAAGAADIDWPGGESAKALSERVAAAWTALLAHGGALVELPEGLLDLLTLVHEVEDEGILLEGMDAVEAREGLDGRKRDQGLVDVHRVEQRLVEPGLELLGDDEHAVLGGAELLGRPRFGEAVHVRLGQRLAGPVIDLARERDQGLDV
jgi:probable phosphoglycerate mutase